MNTLDLPFKDSELPSGAPYLTHLWIQMRSLWKWTFLQIGSFPDKGRNLNLHTIPTTLKAPRQDIPFRACSVSAHEPSSHFYSHSEPKCSMSPRGSPGRPLLPLVPFWDAVPDRGVLALFLSFQPGRYWSSREKLVQMVGLGGTEGSQPSCGNGRCKLLVNNLAHLSLKRVWDSFFFFFKWDPNVLLAPTLPEPPCSAETLRSRQCAWLARSLFSLSCGHQGRILGSLASRLAQEKHPSAP